MRRSAVFLLFRLNIYIRSITKVQRTKLEKRYFNRSEEGITQLNSRVLMTISVLNIRLSPRSQYEGDSRFYYL